MWVISRTETNSSDFQKTESTEISNGGKTINKAFQLTQAEFIDFFKAFVNSR